MVSLLLGENDLYAYMYSYKQEIADTMKVQISLIDDQKASQATVSLGCLGM